MVHTNGQPANGAILNLDAVRGRVGLRQRRQIARFIWRVEKGARRNFHRLGKLLAAINQNLYRHGNGLIFVTNNEKPKLIQKASHLAPVLIDTLTIKVKKEEKCVGELPSAALLNGMLRSETFLKHFRPLDRIVRVPEYLEDFSLAQQGYYDGGEGKRRLYLGPTPEIAESCETINRFLDVMDFATTADRTNTVASALTVMLRSFWPGHKPLVLLTATKSHAGKGTLTDFLRGPVPKADVLYESIDWPMQSQFQRQLQVNPEVGVVLFDNVRLDSAGGRAKFIRSAFVESFVTSAEITLASPGAGEPLVLPNRYVVVINTNDGVLSPDMLNRALTIHLAPRGNVHDRLSPIGNPKLEFLPAYCDRIQAELRGMVERWKAAGRPLDDGARHSMNVWAKTIGGILRVNGLNDFLANFATTKIVNDPTQDALSILAAAMPGRGLRPSEWAELAVEQGLAKVLFSANERDTLKGRERAIGVILSRHLDETFEGRTETTLIRLRLEGGCRRWVRGENPHVRYVFTLLSEEALPFEDMGDAPAPPQDENDGLREFQPQPIQE